MEDRIHQEHQGTQEHPHEGEAQEVVHIHRQCTLPVRVHDARDRDQVHQGTRVQRLGTTEVHRGTMALHQETMALHQEKMVQRQGMTAEEMNVPILERRLVYIQTVWENLGKGKRMFAVDL